MGHRRGEERRAQGETTGEDPEGPDGRAVAGVVLHRDDAGKMYRIELCSGASRRLDLNRLDFERVTAEGASASS